MACATAGPASAGTAGQGTPVKSGWEKSTKSSFSKDCLFIRKVLLNVTYSMLAGKENLLHVYNRIHCTGYESPLLKQGFPFLFFKMQIKQI